MRIKLWRVRRKQTKFVRLLFRNEPRATAMLKSAIWWIYVHEIFGMHRRTRLAFGWKKKQVGRPIVSVCDGTWDFMCRRDRKLAQTSRHSIVSYRDAIRRQRRAICHQSPDAVHRIVPSHHRSSFDTRLTRGETIKSEREIFIVTWQRSRFTFKIVLLRTK